MGCCSSSRKCACPHHKMVSVFITLIGLSFLLTALGVVGETFNNYAWPILLILIGLQTLLGGLCKCCGDGDKNDSGHGDNCSTC